MKFGRGACALICSALAFSIYRSGRPQSHAAGQPCASVRRSNAPTVRRPIRVWAPDDSPLKGRTSPDRASSGSFCS